MALYATMLNLSGKMIGTTVHTAIHWEAVLVTAIPALGAMFGTIGSAWFAWRSAKLAAINKEHLLTIDKAVNGVAAGTPTLREEVVSTREAIENKT